MAQAQAVELDDAAINQKIDPEVYALLVRLNQMGSLLDQHQPCIFLSDQEPLEPDDGVWGIPVLPKGVAIAKVVSDICLLANRLIAEHLHALQLPLPYVVQSAPDANKLADWGKLLSIVAGCDEGDAILQNWQTHLSKLPPPPKTFSSICCGKCGGWANTALPLVCTMGRAKVPTPMPFCPSTVLVTSWYSISCTWYSRRLGIAAVAVAKRG